MKNKIILFIFLVSYLGLTSCKKGTKPTVSFINDLKEESRTQAKDNSYVYSHFLNVRIVKLYNERKLKKTDVVAELKLYHLSGFKKQFPNVANMKYRIFAGDSSESIYHQKDSALMVLMGINAIITDKAGNKVVAVKDMLIPTKGGASKFQSVTDASNLNAKCIEVSEHITLKVTDTTNRYYKNLNVVVLNNPLVFKKEQKYKLHFKVYDKMDANRYFEGETLFTAY